MQYKIEKRYCVIKSSTSIALVIDGRNITLDSGEIIIDFISYQGRAVDITADSVLFIDFGLDRLK